MNKFNKRRANAVKERKVLAGVPAQPGALLPVVQNSGLRQPELVGTGFSMTLTGPCHAPHNIVHCSKK